MEKEFKKKDKVFMGVLITICVLLALSMVAYVLNRKYEWIELPSDAADVLEITDENDCVNNKEAVIAKITELYDETAIKSYFPDYLPNVDNMTVEDYPVDFSNYHYCKLSSDEIGEESIWYNVSIDALYDDSDSCDEEFCIIKKADYVYRINHDYLISIIENDVLAEDISKTLLTLNISSANVMYDGYINSDVSDYEYIFEIREKKDLLSSETGDLYVLYTVDLRTDEFEKETFYKNNKESYKETQLLPNNDVDKNASFAGFISELKNAIKSKNVEFILDHIDDDISFSFGDAAGKEEFIKQWKLESDPSNSEFWDEMQDIIDLGIVSVNSTNTEFIGPYIFTDFPDDFDAFEYVACIGTSVNVRSGASIYSSIIRKVDYLILKRPEYTTDEWTKIVLPNGATGYIATKYIRSAIDYRAHFVYENNKWIITFFIILVQM